jgi:hypothetical protein
MLPVLKRSNPGSASSDLGIDQDYLREIVGKLAFPRPIDSAENAIARSIVAEEFGKFHDPVVAGTTRNVCAGDVATAKILVGAHYDSVPGTPGADDNASAVAVMLAVARAVGSPSRFGYGVRFRREGRRTGSCRAVDRQVEGDYPTRS